MTRIRDFVTHPLVVLVAVLVVLPFATSAFGSTVALATEVTIYVLYGISYNLMLGYTGIVSFGASLFLGTGSYVAALTALHVFQNMFLGLAFTVLFTAALSVVLGLLILRRRGFYFALLTLAFTQLGYEIAFHWTSVTGGENGLQGVEHNFFASSWAFYTFTAVVVALSVAILLRIVHSPFGRVLQVIRDDDRRARCLGYDSQHYKLGAFVISSTFTGLAGGLLSYLIHGAYAPNLNWLHAGDPVFVAIIGGMHHFLGPLWGAIIFINLEDQLSAITEHWRLYFGLVLIAVVLLSPEGLSGIYARLRGNRRWRLTLTPIPPCPNSLPVFDIDDETAATADEEPILAVRGLSKRFGRVVTATNIDVSIRAGQIHSLIGPNGAGKTTFFNMLTGLLTPDEGSILFNGRDVTQLPVHERFRLGMARSFQVVSVPQNLSVFEALRVAVQARSRGHASIWRNAYNLEGVCDKTWGVLHMVGLQERADESVSNLSHGEKRLLDIAMTLAGDPIVLLLDEPLAGLADVDRERISALLTRLSGRYTIVLVEHDIDRVVAISDRITVLHQGHLIAEGTPQEVVSNPDVVEAYLGQGLEQKEDAPELSTTRPAVTSHQPILSVRDLEAGYSGSRVLDGLNLEVGMGEAVALLGRNGVGKTTALYTLIGAVKADAGRIEFDGQDVTRLPANRINRLGLSIVPQGRRIFPNLTVVDNLLIARRPGGWELKDIYELFPKLQNLQSSLGGNLSGGELQMLAIARALMAPTRLILLDEPFEGLAPAVVEEVMQAISRLREHTTILLVEQRVQIALQIVDRVYIMVNGQIAYQGSSRDLYNDKETQVKLLGV